MELLGPEILLVGSVEGVIDSLVSSTGVIMMLVKYCCEVMSRWKYELVGRVVWSVEDCRRRIEGATLG